MVSDYGGYRYLPLSNRIKMNVTPEVCEDYFVAGLVHEINHWAQMYPLGYDDRNHIIDAHDAWLIDDYDNQIIERAAWWGTGFKGRNVRDTDGNL